MGRSCLEGTMKLNADVGEGYGVWTMGDDEVLFPYIHMANIACGGHASDPITMQKTVRLAKKYDVAVGAHPSFPDILGFGRRTMSMDPEEASLHMLSQVGSLQLIAASEGAVIEYIKPHGALYNQMMDDLRLMTSILKALASTKLKIPLMILGTPDHKTHRELADQENVSLLFEAFADRRYTPEGRLQSRAIDGSVFQESEQIIRQAEQIIAGGRVMASNGKIIQIPSDTICIHGDKAISTQTIKQLKDLAERTQ